jgi:DNA-binding PadR family transcriptional regulator
VLRKTEFAILKEMEGGRNYSTAMIAAKHDKSFSWIKENLRGLECRGLIGSYWRESQFKQKVYYITPKGTLALAERMSIARR